MNFKRALTMLAAVAAIAAAAVVCVVAASFALYAFAKFYVGAAGAAAIVSGAFALFALIVAFAITRKARPKPQPPEQAGMAGRLIELARERPIVAAGATVGAAILLARNPKIVTTILSAAIAGRAASSKPTDRRR